MKLVWLIVLSGLLATRTPGQEVQVVAGNVSDWRTMEKHSARDGCEVELRIVGDAAAKTVAIRAVRIRVAEDDTGRDLRMPKDRGFEFYATRRLGKTFVHTRVLLMNPARSAKLIKLLEGELDAVQPTTENGGKIVLKDFQAQPGEPIEAPELKKWNVQLIYVTKETEESALKRLEKGSGGRPTPRRRPFLGSMEGMGFGENAVGFVFNDPDRRLVDLAILDASGVTIETRGDMRGPGQFMYNFEKELPRDAQLVVYLATPESIKTVPFKLENIPLP